jgi:hypothetical protein
MPTDTICADISSHLSNDGYASDRYVREVLEGTKYKRKYQNNYTEYNGSSSELRQTKEQQSQKIVVANTGEQIPTRRNDRDENKLVPLSDFVKLGRAIDDRDSKFKELMQKYAALEIKSAETESELEKLKEELEGADMEIEFLKGYEGAEKIIALKRDKRRNAAAQFYWGKNSSGYTRRRDKKT